MGSNDGRPSEGSAPLPPPSLPPPAPPSVSMPPLPPAAVTTQHVPTPPRRRTGLIVGGVAVAIAVIVAVVLVVGGGDGGPSSVSVSSAAEIATSTVADTEPEATLPVLTAPTTPVTTASTPSGPWGDVDVQGVADATGTFVLQVPVDWFSSNEQRRIFGADAAAISMAPDLGAYRGGDDAVGVTAAVLSAEDVGGVAGLSASFIGGVSACVAVDQQSNHTTVWGPAELLFFDGCGTGGMYAKTVLLVDVSGVTIVVAGQGLGPADGDLLVLVQAFIDSITFS